MSLSAGRPRRSLAPSLLGGWPAPCVLKKGLLDAEAAKNFLLFSLSSHFDYSSIRQPEIREVIPKQLLQ